MNNSAGIQPKRVSGKHAQGAAPKGSPGSILRLPDLRSKAHPPGEEDTLPAEVAVPTEDNLIMDRAGGAIAMPTPSLAGAAASASSPQVAPSTTALVDSRGFRTWLRQPRVWLAAIVLAFVQLVLVIFLTKPVSEGNPSANQDTESSWKEQDHTAPEEQPAARMARVPKASNHSRSRDDRYRATEGSARAPLWDDRRERDSENGPALGAQEDADDSGVATLRGEQIIEDYSAEER